MNFDWDADKADLNFKKHKVKFQDAAYVFSDINSITIFDPDHSKNEERFLTLGLTKTGKVIVVSHLFEEIENKKIRIISARKAEKREIKQYYSNRAK